MTNRTQYITLSAVFMATGIVFPLLFHATGLGPMFLPMFWPMAVAGFVLPLPFAILVGALTPVVSALTTGMPPPPILYKMIVELAVLTGTIRFLYVRTRVGIFWLVVTGLITSRLAAWLLSLAIAPILGLPARFYALVSLLEGLPGVAAIVVLIPVLWKKMKNEPLFKPRAAHVQGA